MQSKGIEFWEGKTDMLAICTYMSQSMYIFYVSLLLIIQAHQLAMICTRPSLSFLRQSLSLYRYDVCPPLLLSPLNKGNVLPMSHTNRAGGSGSSPREGSSSRRIVTPTTADRAKSPPTGKHVSTEGRVSKSYCLLSMYLGEIEPLHILSQAGGALAPESKD